MLSYFVSQEGEVPLTDWEKFAAREYEDLIADEELNKQYEYEDDFEEEDEEIPMMGNVAISAVETYGKWLNMPENSTSAVLGQTCMSWCEIFSVTSDDCSEMKLVMQNNNSEVNGIFQQLPEIRN